MKKLLLVLLVVALASFLLVGCLGTGTVVDEEDNGGGDGDVVESACPTISIADSYTDTVSGKTYINGDADEVVVTFAQPTEGVSIYLVGGVWLSMSGGVELKDKASVFSFDLELPYTVSADGKTYTASLPGYLSELECEPFMIKVVSCDGACECVQSFTLDSEAPTAKIELCIADCSCDGCELSFTSTSDTECAETTEYCGDDCSGLDSWSIKIYADYPFDECCDASCETPIASDSGVCPVDFTTNCLTTVIDNATYGVGTSVFALVTLVDNVGNEVNWGVEIGTTDYDTCETIWFQPITSDCLDSAAGIFSLCE